MSVTYDNLNGSCICIWWIIVFLYLIILMSIFSAEINVIRSLTTSNFKYSNEQMIAFSDSLYNAYQLSSLDPIKNFYLVPTNSSCNDGDELLNLAIWNSKEICSYPYYSNFSLGACPDDAKTNRKYNRYTVNEQRSYLTNWNNVQFCVNRYNYWYKSSDSNCESDYIACPKNLCVQGDQCPINNLMIANSSDSSNLTLNTSSYTYISVGKIGNFSHLFVSRNFNADFIIDLKVSINGKPCIYEFETPKRYSNLSILKPTPNDCATYGRDSSIYSQIDMQNEWDFYSQNNVNYILDGLSLEEYTLGNTAMFFSMTQTPNSCPSGNFLIDSDNSDIEAFSNLRYGGDIFGLVFVIFCLIMFAIHTIYMFCDKKMVESFVISFKILIFIFVEAIICPVSLFYLGKIVKNDKFLNTIITANCFQVQNYNNLFSVYGQEILIDSTKVYGFIHTILYFSLIVFILDILYFIDKISFNYFFDREGGFWEKTNCCDSRDDWCDCDNNIECDCII